MESKMNLANFQCLQSNDFVKFVVGSKEDFNRALEVIPQILDTIVEGYAPTFAFSPVWGSLKPETLAKWMIENDYLRKIGAIYSLQIHKVLKVP
jgi:7-carboxy-7-deazaguanine synthase